MTTSNKMIIPDKINVGYQKREDTYTGKLAYVVYTDAKGILRKEKSWNSWRDKKIKETEHTNDPTSGFVLNKGVGGARASCGWNPRNEYIRVFDPRGFEFEISVANLLFILQETTSTKGKGLEGEFVYSWDGADIVLLPTSCNEFEECSKYTENQLGKVDKKNVVEGCSYLMKDMSKVIYLGRHDWYEPSHDFKGQGNYLMHHGKKHIFKSLEKNGKYIILNGFTKLADRLSEDQLAQYANDYSDFKKSIHSSPTQDINIIKRILLKKEIENLWHNITAIKKEEDGTYKVVDIAKDYYSKKEPYKILERNGVFKPTLIDGKCKIPQLPQHYFLEKPEENKVNLSESELLATPFYTAVLVSTNGATHPLF